VFGHTADSVARLCRGPVISKSYGNRVSCRDGTGTISARRTISIANQFLLRYLGLFHRGLDTVKHGKPGYTSYSGATRNKAVRIIFLRWIGLALGRPPARVGEPRGFAPSGRPKQNRKAEKQILGYPTFLW